MKYHITTTIVNIVLIVIVLNIFQEIYEMFDKLYFVKKGHHFAVFFTYSLFLFSWLAPFIIYKIKNYKRHFYYFFTVNILVTILVRIYQYSVFTFDRGYKYDVKILLKSIWGNIIEIIAPLLVISILVYISQNFIGKKLLPEKYKPLN